MAPADHVQQYITALTETSSIEDIHSVCSQICDAYGFDHFIYGSRTPVSLVRPNLFIISGFPPAWWQHYKEQNYFGVDPTVAHCATQVTPLRWNSLAVREKSDAKIRRFMGESRDFGLRSGVSFPVHGSRGEAAMVSLVSSADNPVVQEKISRGIPALHLLTSHIHESVSRLVEVREIGGGPLLTGRERECLLWASEGKTTWETAQILGISERTVIFHLQNAAGKLNVNSRQHAVARAISLRLITPQFT